MKNVILILVSVIFILSSCIKDPEDPVIQESVLDYYPLSVGNYWVYQRSFCDSTWNHCDSLLTDTSKVVKDTVINNHTYYKVVVFPEIGPKYATYLRDSLDYIVTSKGNIILSSTDFETILKENYEIINGDTIYYYFAKMHQDTAPFETPAGSFNCLDYRISLYVKSDNFEKEYQIHHRFAKYVGPVFNQNMFLFSHGGYKLELIDYHVNQK